MQKSKGILAWDVREEERKRKGIGEGRGGEGEGREEDREGEGEGGVHTAILFPLLTQLAF